MNVFMGMNDCLINLDNFLMIVLSIVLGFMIGLERELTNKWAGLRTHILVCLGACIFTLLSIEAFPSVINSSNAIVSNRDTARVAAQIITGIGFIGGGTVLRNGNSVYGLTTAATLWIVAAIGMACGAGMASLAIFSTLLCVCVLVLIRIFERKFIRSGSKHLRRIKATMITSKEFALEVDNKINSEFSNIIEISKKPVSSREGFIKITVKMDVPYKNYISNTYEKLNNIGKMESVSVQDAYE